MYLNLEDIGKFYLLLDNLPEQNFGKIFLLYCNKYKEILKKYFYMYNSIHHSQKYSEELQYIIDTNQVNNPNNFEIIQEHNTRMEYSFSLLKITFDIDLPKIPKDYLEKDLSQEYYEFFNKFGLIHE